MTGVIVCRDEREYQDVIALLKEHNIFEMATTDQDECEHWTHQLYPGVPYDDGDAYGSVFVGQPTSHRHVAPPASVIGK